MQPIKFIADQAKGINQFKNVRIKLLKCCANIYFNRQCQKLGIIPKYAKIKVPHTSAASTVTQIKAQSIRVKEEIKLLYKKKDKLNTDLYNSHLQAAKEWGSIWHLVYQTIIDTTNQEIEKKYKILDEYSPI
jgi:hypothetical protein